MSFAYLTPAELRKRGLPPGLLIEEAARGSRAEHEGLGRGDSVLTAINGNGLDNSLGSYCDAVQGIHPGTVVTASVLDSVARRRRRVRLPLG